VRKSYHAKGKAADIAVDGVSLEALFCFAETVDVLRGVGFYPGKSFVHVDVREPEYAQKWVFEHNDYVDLTDDKRQQYKLSPPA
jgi:uncharacterized protein YcbK (DUF882 family)